METLIAYGAIRLLILFLVALSGFILMAALTADGITRLKCLATVAAIWTIIIALASVE